MLTEVMPIIITAHIAHSSSQCAASQFDVIIQALAPVIGPYMSRAIATIHSHETAGSTISRTTDDARGFPRAASRRVGARSAGSNGYALLRQANGAYCPLFLPLESSHTRPSART